MSEICNNIRKKKNEIQNFLNELEKDFQKLNIDEFLKRDNQLKNKIEEINNLLKNAKNQFEMLKIKRAILSYKKDIEERNELQNTISEIAMEMNDIMIKILDIYATKMSIKDIN